MSGTSREPSDRISPWVENLLPPLNFAVLLIPVIAMAMELGSAAARLVAATNPTDVAGLETPAQARTWGEPQHVDGDARRGTPDPEPSPASQPHALIRDPVLGDPLLGYGI